MKNIIYFAPSDATKFDLERFAKSLGRYAKVPTAAIEEALKPLAQYENLHVSRLVEAGVALIEKFGKDEDAKKYWIAGMMPKRPRKRLASNTPLIPA